MRKSLSSQLMQRQVFRFFVIVGLALIPLFFFAWANRGEESPYRAADLRATASALDERATEIAAAATRLAPVDVARSAAGTVAPPRTMPGSRSAPIAFGDRFTASDGLEVRVVSVDFDAWAVVQAENQFNKPPAQGMRMILLSLEVTNQAPTYVDVPRLVRSSSFRLVGNRGIVYAPFESTNRCGVIPNEMSWDLFSGATVSGNVCVQAPSDESQFHLIYLPGGGWQEDGVFFALP